MAESKQDHFEPLLAIETSQREGSVALLTADGACEEISFACGGRQEDLLLPTIDRLLERCDLVPERIAATAVSVGPGGFTGLRIAVATVKGIAEVTGCRVVGVPSALVAAEAARDDLPDGRHVVVLSAVKGDTCWCTTLKPNGSGWTDVAPPGLVRVLPPEDGLLDRCSGALVLHDEHVPDGFDEEISGLAAGSAHPVLSARACASVGRAMLLGGQEADPLELTPIYPREPEAVRLWASRNR